MTAPPRRGFLGRKGWVWTFIAGWFVPVIMTCAYIVLALTADTDVTGWAWMGVGLLFVFCLWWMFRELTQTAALSRALAVGDADLVLEIATHALRSRFALGRPELILYQAAAYELRGEWASALRAVEEANVGTGDKPRLRVLATTVRVASLVETGEVAVARGVLDHVLAPLAAGLNPRMDAQLVVAAKLARGRVLVAEHANTEARAVLREVIDDVRTGAATRERARVLAQATSAA